MIASTVRRARAGRAGRAELARLETFLATSAANASVQHQANTEVVRAAPPDDLKTRLKYYHGLVKMIMRTFGSPAEEAEREHELRRLFGTSSNDGLYRARFLASVRDGQLQRAADPASRAV